MSERRGRGKPQGDPSWGDAIWIEAPSAKAARERADRRGGADAAGTPAESEEELPDGVDPERLAAARARSAARRARAQAEREHVVGSGPLEPRRPRNQPRESPWAKAFGASAEDETDATTDGAPADGTPTDGAPADGTPTDGAPADGASGWDALGENSSDPAAAQDPQEGRGCRDDAQGAGGAKGRKGTRGSHGGRGRGRGGRREPAPLPSDPDELRDLARNVVLRHLTGAPRSRHQLEERLADRGIPEEVGAEVLDRMESVRLVDDAAFAETLVRSRHRGRGLARSALRRELRDKGVDGETAEEALEAVTGDDERAAAEELVAKKIRSRPVPTGRDPESRAERDRHVRRLVSMLGRKGYAPGLAFSVVRDAIDAQDD